jgi:4-hydroxybenzoate polyprenyltransferase
LYLGFIARLLLKDFRDIEGDKKYNKTTFLIRYGKAATVTASGVLFAAAMLVVSWSFDFYYSVTVILLLCSGVVAWFLQRLFDARRIDSQHRCVVHVARLANIAIIVIMVYLLCKNQQLDVMTTHVTILILGGVLSGRVLLDHSLVRPAESR